MASINVKPAKLDFYVRKGSTLRRSITWYTNPVYTDRTESEVDTVQSTPIDLTGYSGRMQVRDADTNTQQYELTTVNGGLVFGGAAGTITFFIAHTETDDPTYDDCVYDLEIVDTTGDVIPLLSGSFKLQDQITV